MDTPELGPIAISEPLRRTLAAVRRASGVGPIEVAFDSVSAVERELGCAIPNGVLAFLAATGRSPGAPVPITDEIDGFYEASDAAPKDWRREFRFDHVAFDGWGDWPRYYACWARGANRGDETARVWDMKAAAFFDRIVEDRTLDAVLRFRYELDAKALASLDPQEIAAFCPAIVPPEPERVRRVHHAKFGLGVVSRVLESDKLEIDFGDAGVRVLLSRFVTDVT